MPSHRIAPVDSQPLHHARDVARDGVRALTGAAARFLNMDERDAGDPPRRAPLEAWLAAGCVVVVLWAVGWL
jgi:hypothetical protein